jgi:hypothetical protein
MVADLGTALITLGATYLLGVVTEWLWNTTHHH